MTEQKANTGVSGLDDMLGGGLRSGRVYFRQVDLAGKIAELLVGPGATPIPFPGKKEREARRES